MTQMLLTYQATRFHHPLPPGRLTPRPRLFARLDAGVALARGLVLVRAPAGFGKSTLVSAWLAARAGPWVWLSLDDSDNDPRRLLRHLVIALEGVAPVTGMRLLYRIAAGLQAPAAPSMAELATIIAELALLLAGLPPFVLALDDAHLLSNPQAFKVLDLLLAGRSPALRMVLCAETALPGPGAPPAEGVTLTLDERDLGFSLEEAADLLGWGMGLQLSPAAVAALTARTAGSVAGLQLCALALAGHPEPERLVAALGDAEGQPAVALALQLAAAQGDGAVAAFHCRASLWYEGAGLLDEAVRHAFATGDLVFAAELVERQAIGLIEREAQQALARWCAEFPEPIYQSRPRLCLLHAWSLVLAPRSQRRELVERRLAQAEHSLPAADEATRAWVAGHRANLRGHLLLAAPAPDFEALIAHSQQAMTLLPEDEASVRAMSALRIAYGYMGLSDAAGALHALDVAQRLALRGRNYYGAISCVFDRVRIAHQRGRLREAAQQCRVWKEAFPRLAHDAGPIFPAAGCLDLALGCVLLEQDDLEGAAACLGRGLELTGAIVQFAVVGYPALARLCAARGDQAGAAAALARLEEIWPDTAPYTRGLLALYRLRAAPAEPEVRGAALAWAVAHVPQVSPNTLPPGFGKTLADEPRYGTALVWAHLQTLLGRPREALACLEPLAIASLKHGLAHRVIELSVAQALALDAIGAYGRAQASLARAMALAEPEGYVRVFAQEPRLAALLDAHARAHAPLAADSGPAAASQAAQPRPAEPGQPVPSPAPVTVSDQPAALSDREREVLDLLAEGASTEAIANRLYLSTNTVKTHLRHIYGKLGVHGRQAALARGRELGLLPKA